MNVYDDYNFVCNGFEFNFFKPKPGTPLNLKLFWNLKLKIHDWKRQIKKKVTPYYYRINFHRPILPHHSTVLVRYYCLIIWRNDRTWECLYGRYNRHLAAN